MNVLFKTQFGFTRIPVMLLSIILFGCQSSSTDTFSETIVASVDDHDLLKKEVSDVLPNSLSVEDSVYLAKAYIDSWIKEQVMLNYAENFLSEDQKDFDEELDKYRTSLIIYAYEKAFLKQNLDTLITKAEIANYYKNNAAYFRLKEPVVQVNYFVLPDSLNDIKVFEKLFNNSDLEKSIELEQYCVDNDAKYYFGENHWMYLSELTEKVPLDNISQSNLFQKNKNHLIAKNGKLFFLKIVDFMLKGNDSPVSLQEDKIKDVIINQRKVKLLDKLKEDTYLQAKDNKLIKEYE